MWCKRGLWACVLGVIVAGQAYAAEPTIVEGFAEVPEPRARPRSYYSYDMTNRLYHAAASTARSGAELVWLTQPVPQDAGEQVRFYFACNMAGHGRMDLEKFQPFSLCINGRPAVTNIVPPPQEGEIRSLYVYKGQPATLTFSIGYVNFWRDTFGVAWLDVPISMLERGKPAELKIVAPQQAPDVGQGWFHLVEDKGVAGVMRRRGFRPFRTNFFRGIPYDPDPVQGMTELESRAGVRPWRAMINPDNSYPGRRVWYRDRRYGTWVWMVDDNPSEDVHANASIRTSFNADGSWIKIHGYRPVNRNEAFPRDYVSRWAMSARFDRLIPVNGEVMWDTDDPNVYYTSSGPNAKEGQPGKVIRHTIGGEPHVLGTFESTTHRFYRQSRDGKYLVVHDKDGAAAVQVGNDPEDTIRMYIGTRYARDGSEVQRIVWPADVRKETLERLAKIGLDGLALPDKSQYRPLPKTVQGLYDLWRYYPTTSHGHGSWSPSRERASLDDAGGVSVQSTRPGDRTAFAIDLPHEFPNDHTFWWFHPEWLITDACTNYYTLRAARADTVYKVYLDGTYQPIVRRKSRISRHYTAHSMANLSPDGTKLLFVSSMMHYNRCYIAVISRPLPPVNPAWNAEDDEVRLSWSPPEYAKEIAGYCVYRGARSRGPYTLLTPKPIRETHYVDATIRAGEYYYYVITSVETSNLESAYSAELSRVCSRPARAPDNRLVLYREAEFPAERSDAAIGRDVRGASNWHYMYRNPKAVQGEFTMRVRIEHEDRYYLWGRGRNTGIGWARWGILVDGPTLPRSSAGASSLSRLRAEALQRAKARRRKQPGLRRLNRDGGNLDFRDTGWHWSRTLGSFPIELAEGEPRSAHFINMRARARGPEPFRLTRGEHEFVFFTHDKHVQLDLLCLTNDRDFVPKGPRPEDTVAPAAPGNLSANSGAARYVTLEWTPCGEPDFGHFNVYSAREPFDEAGQEYLIASPTLPKVIDWGLRAGTTYHYRITAVDRLGNESAPSAMVAAKIPPRERPVARIELEFENATWHGDAKIAEDPTASGSRYALPPPAQGRRKSGAQWTVTVHQPGTYYVWFRHTALPGGPSWPDVLVDGKPVAGMKLNHDNQFAGRSMENPNWLWVVMRRFAENPTGVPLTPGEHKIVVRGFLPNVKLDKMVLIDEPSFRPKEHVNVR